jgi:catalase
MQKPIQPSYGQSGYHAEHAFRFTASDGTSRFGRYHFIPEAGEAYLSPTSPTASSSPTIRSCVRSAAYSISYERRHRGE